LDFGIVIAAAVDLLGLFFDYEQEHEQEFSTHLRIMMRQFVS